MAAPMPPGPPKPGFYRSPKRYGIDRLHYIQELHRQYGDVCQVWIGLWHVYLVNHPDYIQQIFVREHEKVEKSWVIKLGRILLGDGLLSSEGELHKRQRRLMSPAFHRKRIRAYGEVMRKHAEAITEEWNDGQEVDMHLEMNRLTLSIIGETMFGADVRDEARIVNHCLEIVFGMLPRVTSPQSLLLCLLPLPSNFRFLWARYTLFRIVKRLVRERVNQAENRDDVLSMLLSARDTEGDGKGMSLKQVRDEVLILFLAGHETTANALTWAWYLLSQHPDVDAKMHEEFSRVLAGRAPGLDDLEQLPYTRMVMEESMRLYPPVYIIDRRVKEEMEVGGYHVPRGVTFFLSPWLMHRDARFYPDPERYDPERWTPEAKAARPKYSYFPFGAGPRSCIGEQFAWTEALIVLATIAQRFKVHLVEGQEIVPQPQVTLRPKNGLR